MQFQQGLIFIELGLGKLMDRAIGETAEDQIHFAHAAMPGAEQEFAPTSVEPVT